MQYIQTRILDKTKYILTGNQGYTLYFEKTNFLWEKEKEVFPFWKSSVIPRISCAYTPLLNRTKKEETFFKKLIINAYCIKKKGPSYKCKSSDKKDMVNNVHMLTLEGLCSLFVNTRFTHRISCNRIILLISDYL